MKKKYKLENKKVFVPAPTKTDKIDIMYELRNAFSSASLKETDQRIMEDKKHIIINKYGALPVSRKIKFIGHDIKRNSLQDFIDSLINMFRR